MKILIFSNTAWSIYNFRRGLLQALKNEGHQIFILSNKDGYEQKIKNFGMFSCIKLNQRGVNPLNELSTFIGILYYLYKIKPNIIFTYTIKPNIYGSLAARLLNIPIVVNVTGLGDTFSAPHFLRKLLVKFIKISFRKNKKIFLQNKSDFRIFKHLGFNEKDMGLLPGSGINVNEYNFYPMILNKNMKFLFVGRLLKNKGFYEFAFAAEILKLKYQNVEFGALGLISRDDELLIRNILKRGVIDYYGHVDDVKPFLINSDCIVLPSYYREGTPRSLIEAAAIGRPIITTNMPGCRDMVINEGINGYLCKPKSVDDLVCKMQKIIDTPFDKICTMGKFSRELAVSNYDENIVINEYLNVLR